MFKNVGGTVALLGGAAGLTFCLAGGVTVGAVPQAGEGLAGFGTNRSGDAMGTG